MKKGEQLHKIIRLTKFNLDLIKSYFKEIEREKCSFPIKILSKQEKKIDVQFLLYPIEKFLTEYNFDREINSQLKIEFKDIFEDCGQLLNIYNATIKELLEIKTPSPYIGTASVNDQIAYLRQEIDYLIAPPGHYNVTDMNDYCNKLYTLLNEKVFEEKTNIELDKSFYNKEVKVELEKKDSENIIASGVDVNLGRQSSEELIEPTTKKLNSQSEINTNEKKLKIEGNYKQLCFLFRELRNNKTKHYFENTPEEIANVISNFFHFSHGKQATFDDIFLELVNENDPQIISYPPRVSKLVWTGRNNQIYFVFRQIYHVEVSSRQHSKRLKYHFSIQNNLDEIGQFICTNIHFKKRKSNPNKAIVMNELARPVLDICPSQNQPYVNWDALYEMANAES